MRILLVSKDIPSPSRAGSRRPYQLLRFLADRHALSLVYPYYRLRALEHLQEITGQGDLVGTVRSFDLRPRHTTVYRKLCTRLSGRCLLETRMKFPTQFSRVVQTIRWLAFQSDVLWVADLASMQYVDAVHTPTVLDAVDCFSRNVALRLSRLSPRWRRALWSWLARPLPPFERRMHAGATLSVVNSRVDANYMVERDLASPAVVENGCDTDYFSPNAVRERVPLAGKPVIVFVGVFQYHPNEDAARWLIQDLVPRLLRHYPRARLVLVGPPPSNPLPISSDHVVATGCVPDVRPYYAGADVFVAPLRYGTGIKHKIMEAAAMECRIVATPSAVEGLSLRHGHHLFIADGADAFVACIRGALEGKEAVSMAKRARALVVHRHSWQAQGERFEALLREAVSRHMILG